MPYEMNEGGFLSGGFVQDLYDRNQEYEDMRRANAAAESYWKQLKMQQEIEREADLNSVSSALTEGMVPLSADVDEHGQRRVHLGYPKDAKPVKDFTTVSGRGGHWVYNFDGTREWVPDPSASGTDRKKVTDYVNDQGQQVVGYDDGTTQVFGTVQGKPATDPWGGLRNLGQREMARAIIGNDAVTADRAGLFLDSLAGTTMVPSPFGGQVPVTLATAGAQEDPLARALSRIPMGTNAVVSGTVSNALPAASGSPVAPVSSGGTVLQLGMDGSVTQSATARLKVAARGGNLKAQQYLKSKNIIW